MPDTGAMSCCGLDVLVEAEQVRRIVLVLQRNQPFIFVGTVGCSDPIRLLSPIEVVDVNSVACKWLHRLPKVAHPLDVTFCFCGVEPSARNEQTVVSAPLTERRLVFVDAAPRATQFFEDRRRERRRNG